MNKAQVGIMPKLLPILLLVACVDAGLPDHLTAAPAPGITEAQFALALEGARGWERVGFHVEAAEPGSEPDVTVAACPAEQAKADAVHGWSDGDSWDWFCVYAPDPDTEDFWWWSTSQHEWGHVLTRRLDHLPRFPWAVMGNSSDQLTCLDVLYACQAGSPLCPPCE